MFYHALQPQMPDEATFLALSRFTRCSLIAADVWVLSDPALLKAGEAACPDCRGKAQKKSAR